MNRNSIYRLLISVALPAVLVACGDKTTGEPMNYVDLRYRVSDSYDLPASAAEPVIFLVRSDYPWKISSSNPSWVEIKPSEGAKDLLTEVRAVYSDNVDLDDRVDTLTIKSDHWVGKKVIVRQKGIAYLSIVPEKVEMPINASTRDILVRANQNWSVEVSSGDSWLSVSKGSEGNLDGSFSISADKNPGEQREGSISILDRHKVLQSTLRVIQEGVILSPESTELRVTYEAQEVLLPVTSNSEWTVTKTDESVDWFSFEKTSFSGNESVTVRFKEQVGSEVRRSSILLSSVAAPGIAPVTKEVVIKQAFNPVRVTYQFNQAEVSKWVSHTGTVSVNGDDLVTNGNGLIKLDNAEAGIYEFHIKSYAANSQSEIFFYQTGYTDYDRHELRWRVNNGKTFLNPYPWMGLPQVPIAVNGVPFTLGIKILPSTAPNAGVNADIYYFFNEAQIPNAWIDSRNRPDKFNEGGTNYPLFDASRTFSIILGASRGSVVWDSYSFTPIIDWGD
ncbi:MAG: BACON domain-containing carbohydrate-binding protein [Porphyromonas sp.]|nr:BACON domain-containing carbohydrate-binding protein [Bacteroidales bacterium]MDY3100692.1 BACON domain-containing carbohydrate-binding protein [Porphyromonas sp.]